MGIIFKPPGSLDISTDPSSLPERSDGKTLVSGEMTRCKNLRLDQAGVLKTRDGSQKFTTNQINEAIDFIIEQNGDRYTFAGTEIYKNEVVVSGSSQCETPEFSPDGGSYSGTQSVTITTGTRGTIIYYTLNGLEPSRATLKYDSPVSVSLPGILRAIAVKTGFADSDEKEGRYLFTSFNLVTEGGDTLITETDSDNIVNEGAS